MAKVNVKKLMKQSAEALKDVMIEQLGTIADNMINQIMAKSKGLTYSNRLDALIGLTPDGINNYKSMLFDAMVIIANDGIDSARKEVPKAKKVKLSTTTLLKNLPPKLQDKIKTRNQLLIGKQVGDLQKTLEFAYATNEDTTDSYNQLREDLEDAGLAWLDGTAVRLGADITAATIINESRNAFFMDDDVLEQIDAFEFVNGDPISPICQDLAGTVFAKDDADMFRYTPPLHFNAVCQDALITTHTGEKKIKNIKLYDLVLTHKNRFKPVTEVMSKFEDKEYFELKTDDGKILNITGEHPVLTIRAWVRTDELTLNDEVMTIDQVYSKIVSITKKRIINETLHNLAVQDDESYIANGIVVHNCKSSIQAILSGDLGKREIKKLQPSSAELEDSIQFSDAKHTSKCGHHHTKEFQDLVDCIVFLKE